MRWSVTLVLAVASLGFAVRGARGADPPEFPEYRPPSAPTRRFAASRATIEFAERLPKGEPSVFSTPAGAESKTPAPPVDPKNPPATISKEELGRVLDRRLGRTLGKGAETLVFEATIVDAKGGLYRHPVTSVTLDVRVRRPGGPSLVATRGVSRLSGYLGGMSGDMGRILLAAVIDAFERAVLRDEFIVATNEALSAQPAEGAVAERIVPGPRHNWTVQYHTATGSSHVAAVTFDAGDAYAFGLRYLHDHYHSGTGLFWGGYGAELRGLTNGDSFAPAGLVVLRGGLGVEQGFVVEVGAGVAGGDEAQGMALLGLFLSLYFVDIGVTGQTPFVKETPEWMAPVSLGIRVNVPFHRTSANIERNSPLPAGTKFFPGFSGGDDEEDD